jgi:hypothetical protein
MDLNSLITIARGAHALCHVNISLRSRAKTVTGIFVTSINRLANIVPCLLPKVTFWPTAYQCYDEATFCYIPTRDFHYEMFKENFIRVLFWIAFPRTAACLSVLAVISRLFSYALSSHVRGCFDAIIRNNLPTLNQVLENENRETDRLLKHQAYLYKVNTRLLCKLIIKELKRPSALNQLGRLTDCANVLEDRRDESERWSHNGDILRISDNMTAQEFAQQISNHLAAYITNLRQGIQDDPASIIQDVTSLKDFIKSYTQPLDECSEADRYIQV